MRSKERKGRKGARAALIGTFVQGGRTLVVSADGAATRGTLTWSPSGQPVTRGTIGLNEKGEPVYYDGSEMAPVAVEREGEGGAGPATVISIMTMKFTRKAGEADKK